MSTTHNSVHGAWARAIASEAAPASSPGLVLPVRGVSPSRAQNVSTALHDSMLTLMEGMGELQEQVKELLPLKALPGRVSLLEWQLEAAEERERDLRADLSKAQETITVLTGLVSRMSKEDAAAQQALSRLTEEAQRLKALAEGGTHARKGHGSVRTFGSPSPRK